MAIYLVTLDLDNTLWDVETVIRRAEAEMRTYLAEHATNFDAGATDFARLRDAVIARSPEVIHDLSTLRRRVLAAAMTASGYGEREARHLADEAFEVFLAGRHKVEYFEGALDALEALAHRYVLGALTNGNADVARLGLDRFFRFHLSAADVGIGKPAPAMFEAALTHVNATPGESVHVGDHPDDDVRGAREAGMHAIWVNLSGGAWPYDDPAPEVRALSELPDAIARLDT